MRGLFLGVIESGFDWDIWKLIAISLIFFMQAGFAMCEAGFTRSKNTGNITMKNLMDFCLGTITFIIIGAPLLIASDAICGGMFGNPVPVWKGIFSNPGEYDWTKFIFNLVFCATTATIVSGAMAERTNFKAYCIYSMIISAIVYPVEAFWVWGTNANGDSIGWLQKFAEMFNITFIDFSGSAAIHMVGGLTALIGAYILGPRLGKYTKDENGKVIKVNAIQGHNILMGALGVFILWFGWYGFNASGCTKATGYGGMGHVFMTTTIAASISTVTVMLITWIKNKKPDVSMSLNGSLAGLVAITAGCATVDLIGSIVIGIVAGALLCFGVEFIDKKLHIDDPVGACSVHFLNGLWGTLACGFFSYETGLFYGHGFSQLLVQLVGILAICSWTALWAVAIFITMKKIKRSDNTPFLRATIEEEIKGLDITEHGLQSAYSGFLFAPEELDYNIDYGSTPIKEAVSVNVVNNNVKNDDKEGITKIEIVCKERMLEALKSALIKEGVTGMTVSHVMGCGVQKGAPEYYRGVKVEATLLPKIQIDIVVERTKAYNIVNTARKVLYTGHIGDGKIFVYDCIDVVKVRTGEEGIEALTEN